MNYSIRSIANPMFAFACTIVWMSFVSNVASGQVADNGSVRTSERFAPREYIRSSSPLPGGGRVTTQSIPGLGIQTRTDISGIPDISSRPGSGSPGDGNYNRNASGFFQPGATSTTISGTPAGAATNVPQSVRGSIAPDYSRTAAYPYPAAQRGYPQSGPVQPVGATARLNPNSGGPNRSGPFQQPGFTSGVNVQHSAFQANDLNFGGAQTNVPKRDIDARPATVSSTHVANAQYPNAQYANPNYNNQIRTAQNCNCNQGGFQAPANQPPSLNVQMPPGYQTPTQQTFQSPAIYPGSNPAYNYQVPPVGQGYGGANGFSNFCNGVNGQVGQAGSAFSNWFNPLYRGTGAYQPIIRLQNMPPGAYLGQGIIGQPTAYVDGQPFRNLLRYVSP